MSESLAQICVTIAENIFFSVFYWRTL